MRHDERAGVLVAVAGFILLSVGDAIWKFGVGEWAPTAMAATRYTLGALGLAGVLALKEGRAGFRVARPMVQLLRSGGVTLATACFVSALRFIPLVEVTAIAFISPIFTALLAAAALREPVGRETWLATLGGFVGVLIVLRPSLSELGVVALLPIFSAFGMSMLVIGNRMSAQSGTPLAMQFQVAAPSALMLWGVAAAGHVSGISFLHVAEPAAKILAICAVIAVLASVAHMLVYLGTVKAGAATIAPMTYVQIIVAGILGWLLFGTRPDAVALAGIAIIIGSGLYLWHSRAPVAVQDEAA